MALFFFGVSFASFCFLSVETSCSALFDIILLHISIGQYFVLLWTFGNFFFKSVSF